MSGRLARAGRPLALLAAAVLVSACVTSGPRVAWLSADPEAAASTVGAQTRDEALLHAIAKVLVTRLGIPLTPPVRVVFYPSQAAFERGLRDDARLSASLARDQAAFALGVGTSDGIYLRGDRLQSSPLATRVGTIAHELTHIAQYQVLGGRRGTSEQWLREGFAEWAKFGALDELGVRAFPVSRDAVVRGVREAMHRADLPRLETVADNRDWIAARRTAGTLPTYGQAFLAVDRLVTHAGRDAMVGYFRRSGTGTDREATFAAAFGLSRAEFFADFARYLGDMADLDGRL